MIKPLMFFTFLCISINLFAQQGITEIIKLYEEGLFKYSELEDFDGATSDFKNVIVDFNKAIELDPEVAATYDYRGRAKYYLDDEKGAIVDYNKAIELDPEVAATYDYRGRVKYYLEDYEGAIADYTKAIELDPDVAIYYNNRGEANSGIEDYEGAIEDYTNAIELDPEVAATYDYRGQAKYYLDDEKGAIADYNKAIELNPKYANAYNNRALVKDYIKDYEGAIADFNRAISIDSLMPLYFKNLGGTLEKIKNFKDAKIQFINAAKLDPSGDITNYNTRGYYYPNVVVGENDEIKFPIEVDIELFVEDIFNFDTKNDQFFLRFNYAMYSSISANYMTENNDTINQITDLRKTVKVDYIKSDQTQINQLTFDPFYDDIVGYSYQGSLESSFYHNWDLSEYPFDKQNVQVRFKSSLDSTIFKFKESMRFPASFNKKMIGLKEGFKIDTITFHNSHTNGWYELDLSPTLTRNIIYPIGVFDIIISRKSFWLFIKLFLGSILSFLISWIVFLIPKKQFESRISLTVGGIFGAIGNRYFVDSTIPSVQYLTKADMINNLILLLLILNIFIVIIQENDKINFGPLEQNKFAMIFTGIAFVVLNTLIVLW